MNETIAAQDLDRFLNASIEDLVFVTDQIPAHRDRCEQRIGFRLVQVAGINLPAWIRLAYVTGRSGIDEFVYVVIWRSPDADEPETHDVPSEAAARAALLQAFRALVSSERV
jgi:hypothetical protein